MTTATTEVTTGMNNKVNDNKNAVKICKDCEMISATITNDTRCEMKFYDAEENKLLTVRFNKQSWDSNRQCFVDDPKKAEKCEEWAQKYFGCGFDDIPHLEGVRKDIYCYDTFNSLWEVEQQEKPKRFDSPIKGIIKTKVEDVIIDAVGIHVRYKYQGEVYESKFKTSQWVDKMHKFIPDEDLSRRARKHFKETFGVDPEEKDTLIGMEIQVQVKKAFNTFFGEILPR